MSKSLFSERTMPPLSDEERHVLLGKGTEAPFSGKFCHHDKAGRYFCRACGQWLYRSDDKFDSGCGWPSFDNEVPGAVARIFHATDGRTEIVCGHCGGHLGHVFTGESMTPLNVRHCVNSASLHFEENTPDKVAEQGKTDLAPDKQDTARTKQEIAVFAGGCFWGVEQAFRNEAGVSDVVSGYTGGKKSLPTYQDVCAGSTGHAEAVQVTFDPVQISYEALARLFFEIHDPTQCDGQGPDRGTQYRSAIFYVNGRQKMIADGLVDDLRSLGFDVMTEVTPLSTFYPAEKYHQHFAENHPHVPCHRGRTPRFAGKR